MLCEICRVNEAEYHIVSILNGKQSVRHLCADCANKRIPFATLEKLQGLPIAESGVIGAREAVKKLLYPALKQILLQGDEKIFRCPHCGKPLPDNFLQFPFDAEDADGKNVLKTQESTERKLEKLSRLLKSAVKAENYETAAELRDKISELREQKESAKREKEGS